MNTTDTKETALRYNAGKPMLSLIPPIAELELGKVFTYGLRKYAKNNWRKGLSWSSVIDSIMRHVNALRQGEDIDPESGCMHAAHVMANAAFLIEYSTIYPEGDDRLSKN